MSSAYAIRPATGDDVAAVIAVAEASAMLPRYAPEFYYGLLQPQRGMGLRRVLLVVEVAGEVAGFAVASALAALSPAEAELESIAVAPKHHGCGLGEALVQAVIAWSAKTGVLRLEVRSRNTTALRLYSRCGFRQTARRANYYTGPTDDAICMELRCEESCTTDTVTAAPVL